MDEADALDEYWPWSEGEGLMVGAYGIPGERRVLNGYVLVYCPDHPHANVRGYVYEHRLVAERMLGRYLLPTEEVHHKDAKRKNNHPSNLVVVKSRAHHQVLHRRRDDGLRLPDEPNTLVDCACGCGAQHLRFNVYGRPRRFIAGHIVKQKPMRDAVIAALRDGKSHRREIAAHSGLSRKQIDNALSRLRVAGAAQRIDQDHWSLVVQSHG